MSDPIFIVGVSFDHAKRWSQSHVSPSTRVPVLVSPENVNSAFRGQRNRVIVILADAFIPREVAHIKTRNTIIDLNQGAQL